MFIYIYEQRDILIAGVFPTSPDVELRRTGNDRAELYVRSTNSYTVIPRFATLDRVALSDFLCLSVSAEEDGGDALHAESASC